MNVKIALIILGFILCLGAGAALGVYFLSPAQPDSEQSQQTVETAAVQEEVVQEEEASAIDITIGEEEADDGSVEYESEIDVQEDGISIRGTSANTEDCGFEGCFMEKFAACEPAVSTADIGLAAVQHEIIGPVGEVCKISFKYTRNPNPDWENKYLYCVLDPGSDYSEQFQDDFEAAMDGAGSCYGPLAEVLQAM